MREKRLSSTFTSKVAFNPVEWHCLAGKRTMTANQRRCDVSVQLTRHTSLIASVTSFAHLMERFRRNFKKHERVHSRDEWRHDFAWIAKTWGKEILFFKSLKKPKYSCLGIAGTIALFPKCCCWSWQRRASSWQKNFSLLFGPKPKPRRTKRKAEKTLFHHCCRQGW